MCHGWRQNWKSMDTDIQIEIDLRALVVSTAPVVTLCIDGTDHGTWIIEKNITIRLEECLSPGNHRLSLYFQNKKYEDATQSCDMAVIVDAVRFQYLDHDFKVYSRYIPDYPEPWASQQEELETEIHSNYLGWNGEWFLDFQTPIYAWAHKTMGLGWLL